MVGQAYGKQARPGSAWVVALPPSPCCTWLPRAWHSWLNSEVSHKPMYLRLLPSIEILFI